MKFLFFIFFVVGSIHILVDDETNGDCELTHSNCDSINGSMVWIWFKKADSRWGKSKKKKQKLN